MECIPVKIEVLKPPKDDLYKKITASKLELQEYDVIAIASKVVAIAEGRCVAKENRAQKDRLIKEESQFYIERKEVPGNAAIHTITHEQLAVSAGLDPFGGHYILWPKNPMLAAEELCSWIKEEYNIKNVGVVITDSKSTPLRRGVVGGAIGWAGFSPLFDNRSRIDLLGKKSGGSQINVADGIAAAAVFAMGEGNEQTPLVVVRDAPYIKQGYQARKDKHNSYVVPREKDLFAPFFNTAPWKKGGAGE